MSHKFKVEIELEDGRFCDGCPLIDDLRDRVDYDTCFISLDVLRGKNMGKRAGKILDQGLKPNGKGQTLRPQACIDKYGK